MRRSLLFAAALLAACSREPRRPGIPPSHLLLVTVAGLRADHCSCLNYARPTTLDEVDAGMRAAGRALSIDDLASDGVLFTRAFAPSTEPVVSLASLLTGRSPLETGLLHAGSELAPSDVTLAEALSAAGFATAAFATLPAAAGTRGLEQGFERLAVSDGDARTLGLAATWYGEHDFGNARPTFVWIHLAGPLPPFEPRAVEGRPERGGRRDFARLFDVDASEGPARERALTLAQYDGELAQTTFLLESLLDYVLYATATSGAWSRTVLALAGTGGPELFDCQTELDEGLLHVPLLLRHPDSLTGERLFDPIVELADVAPTLLEWFRVPIPSAVSGRSLLAVTDSHDGRRFDPRPALAVAADEGGVKALSARGRVGRYTVDSQGARLLDPSLEAGDLDPDLIARAPRECEPISCERAERDLAQALQQRIGALELAPRVELGGLLGGP